MKSPMITTGLATGLLVAVAVPAMADGWRGDGLYGSVRGGFSAPSDQKFNNVGTKAEFENGWNGSAAIGTQRGNTRLELEAMHQEADVDHVTNLGVQTSGGETKLDAAMINGYYDFKNSSYWTPYVGLGAGYGRVKFKNYNPAGGGNAINDSDGTLAYQGMAGVSYELNPCWSFNGEYRYVGTTDADVTTAGGTNTNARYESHNLIAGVTYHF